MRHHFDRMDSHCSPLHSKVYDFYLQRTFGFWLVNLLNFCDLFLQTFRRRAKEIEILVGTNKLSLGEKRYKANKTITHEHYNEPWRANDIALIRTQIPIQFDTKVKPIKRGTKEIPSGTKLQTSGWGRLWASSHNIV